jgi:HTH-type transcriptional regulator/antitoxin HigA
MTINSINTEQEYDHTLVRIDQLFDAPKGSIEAKELNLLILSVNEYEAQNYPIDEPDPIEYIKIRMEEISAY